MLNCHLNIVRPTEIGEFFKYCGNFCEISFWHLYLQVDIRLPRDGDADMSLVVVSGDDDNVQDCIDHLKIMEEEYIQDVADREWMKQYEKPTRAVDNKDSGKDASKGFYVAKAPWDVSSTEAFPSLGGGGGATSKPPAWGPARR